MKDDSSRKKLSLADAIDNIFGIQLSKHHQIKHALNSLVRNEVIEHEQDAPSGGHGSRGRIWVYRDQLDLIHNAVILQGLFSDTKIITKIIKDSGSCAFRCKMAEFAQVILVGRQSIVGISLLAVEVKTFLRILGSDTELTIKRLPNPFEILPQLVLAQGTSAIESLLAQGATQMSGDTMMIHYLNEDLEAAWGAAQQMDVDDPILQKYKALIEREYTEAQEFDDLLDALR